MRVIFFFLFLVLSLFSKRSFADIGCNLGNDIFPTSSNLNNASGYPYYNNSGSFPIRWWNEDPRPCGIRDNKITAIVIMKDGQNDAKCQILGTNNWGMLYSYNPLDNTCNLPLDDYIPLFILIFSAFGFYYLRKRGSLLIA